MRIIADESPDRAQFAAVAQACEEHLLLDPDKDLSRANRVTAEHVTIHEFVEIVRSLNRQGKLTLIYDQSNQRANAKNVKQRIQNKLQQLRANCPNVHAMAYRAHSNIAFIWASTNPDVITYATQTMQRESHFPAPRFVDDNCGRRHVGN